MFGEAGIELIVLVVIFIFLIYGLTTYFRLFKKNIKKTWLTENYKDNDDDKEYTLLKMVYSDNLTMKSLTENLGISLYKLDPLLNKLVEHGLIQITPNDEFKITENGIKYLEYIEWSAQAFHHKHIKQ
jgi:predicted transcriptional regulator